MEDKIQLSPEQENALHMMLSGKNVFLTGEAGTGKSTILRKFREQCTRECVFLAPTGIAAINIGGATLHSFFLLKPGLLTPDSIEEINNKSRKALIRKVKTIVIDEISMVRSDVFAAMDFRLRSLASGSSQLKPFGGKQIILVGDFFQLPPVVKTETEDTYLNRQLGGYYVFQTALWKKADFHCVFLKTIHRQQNDNLFLSILNHIRHGELDQPDLQIDGIAGNVNVIQALSELCTNQPPLDPEPIYLCTIIDSVTLDNIVSWKKYANVKVRLTGDVRKFAASYRMHSRQTVKKQKDGSWLFTIPEVPEQVIVPWILSQGGDAVPLEPQEIVDAVRSKVVSIAEKTGMKVRNGSN